MSVTLLEQNQEVGGRCQSVHLTAPLPGSDDDGAQGQRSGVFRFDTGPSLLLFPDTYKSTFTSLGEDIADHVQMLRVEDAAYRVHFEGRGSLDMLYDVQAMVQQMESVEPGAGAQYLAWLASARAALDAGMSTFIERDFDSVLDMLDLSKLLPLLPKVNVLELLLPHYQCLKARFKDERLRALFTFQDLYVGLSPYDAPGAFSLLAGTELTDAVWYPEGGFTTVRSSLCSIAERLGVCVLTGTRVSHIDTSADGRQVTGVTLSDGRTIHAATVVANADVATAYRMIRGGAHQHGAETARHVSRMSYSAGIIAFNWCVARPMPGLRQHNVFLSAAGEAAWQRATSASTLLTVPNFYVHAPARTDPTAAPDGCESVMVLLPVANLQEMATAGKVASSGDAQGCSSSAGSGAYSELIEAGREAILHTMAAAGVCGAKVTADELRSSIVKEMVIEPEGWANRYGLEHGAAFGLAHGLDQLAAFRPSTKDARAKGLYFCGASTRPGNGVPLVMISADLVVQRVLKDMRQ